MINELLALLKRIRLKLTNTFLTLPAAAVLFTGDMPHSDFLVFKKVIFNVRKNKLISAVVKIKTGRIFREQDCTVGIYHFEGP